MIRYPFVKPEAHIADLRPECLAAHVPEVLVPPGVLPNGGNRVLSVAGVPIVTMMSTNAEDNLTSIDALALQWAQSLDRELARAQERRLAWGGRFVAEVRASVVEGRGHLYAELALDFLFRHGGEAIV